MLPFCVCFHKYFKWTAYCQILAGQVGIANKTRNLRRTPRNLTHSEKASSYFIDKTLMCRRVYKKLTSSLHLFHVYGMLRVIQGCLVPDKPLPVPIYGKHSYKQYDLKQQNEELAKTHCPHPIQDKL